MRFAFLLFSAVMLVACSIEASVLDSLVTLQYDDGSASGYFDLESGDIEAVRFTPLHPCSLLSIRLRIHSRTGRTQNFALYIWADNGGHQPDISAPLALPLVGHSSGASSEWIDVDLRELGIELPALTDFFVGHLLDTDDEPVFYVDGTEPTVYRSVLRMGGTWYVAGDGDFIARCDVSYHSIIPDDARWFEDISESCGLSFGSRFAWGDYNNDGFDDVMVNGSYLFRNNGDGTFSNVTSVVGLDSTYASGGVWGDFDNDGFLDFYAKVNASDYYDILWKNIDGEHFSDVSMDYGCPFDSYPTEGVLWGDFNNDSFIDLYVANYERPDEMSVPTPDYLWLNVDGTHFIDATDSCGISSEADECGRGVCAADFDFDGDLDIYVSNYRLNPNFLWLNSGDGIFINSAEEHGIEGVPILSGGHYYYGHTIGSEFADFDNDGDFDLFCANLAHPRFIDFSDKSMLYENEGTPDFHFSDVREDAGIVYQETNSDVAWSDFDNDGYLDLFITNVYVGRKSALYRNNGDGTFTEVSYPAGVRVDNGWGCAWSDFDNDGFLDLVSGSEFHLYHNRGNSNHWIEVRLEGRDVNRSAIGSYVFVYSGGMRQLRQVEGGKGTSTQNSLRLHFGLGGATVVDSLEIHWLGSERVEKYYNIPADVIYTAIESEGLFSSIEELAYLPKRLSTCVYPNPFNAGAYISFEIMEPISLSVEIYNSLGEMVRTVPERFYPSGRNRIFVSNDGLSSGTYLYVIKDGKRVFSSGKMIHLK